MEQSHLPVRRTPRQIVIKPTLVERAIAQFSPQRARQRMLSRFAYEVLARGYEGATVGRRAGGWITSGTSANAEILPALSRLRERSRDLARNNSYAGKAIRTLTDSVVSTGILPEWRHTDAAVRDAVKELWLRWGESKQCDADGRHDFYGLQRLVARTMFESGEVLIRRRFRRPEDGLAVPLQLQVLEPDFLDASKDGELDGNTLVQGIEFDRLGRRVAYWLHQTHPGDRYAWRRGDSVRVPASEILHLFEQDRPGQARGVPRAASVIIRLRNFDEYEDAQLQKQIIAACFAAFVVDATGAASTPAAAAAASNLEAIESGTIETLPPGKDIRFSEPPSVDGYGDYAQQVLHAVAAGFNVPYELLTGDFSRVNFSSARMALLSYYRHVDVLTWCTAIPGFCAPAAAWFLNAARTAGILRQEPAVIWRPPRREMVSPKDEIYAIKNAVRSGLMSLPQAILEVSGEDPERMMQDVAKFNELLDKLGIVLDSDPRKIALGGYDQPSITIEQKQ